MILQSIIWKETATLLRNRRAAYLLVFYLAAMALVIVFNWPGDRVVTLAAQASKKAVYLLAFTNLLMVLSVIPGITAASIVSERESGQFDLLRISHCSPFALLVGKWAGAVVFSLVLLICSVPFVSIVSVLGTLELQQVVYIYTHLFFTALWTGLLGLLVSACTETTYRSLAITYTLIIAISGATVIPAFLLAGEAIGWLRSVGPLGSMINVIHPSAWQMLEPEADLAFGLAPYLFASTVLSLLCFAGIEFRLRNPRRTGDARQVKLIDDRREIIRRKLRFPFYLIDPQRRRRPIGRWINPVFSRLLRSRMLGQATIFLRVFYSFLIISMLLTIYSVFSTGAEIVDSVRVLAIGSQVALIGLLAPMLTSSSINRERELETMELLRMTRLSPWQLVAGNWMYALMISSCLMVAALPLWVVMLVMQRVPAGAVLRGVAVVSGSLVCGTATGVIASSFIRRTGVATGVAYCLTFIMLFGSLFPLVFSESVSGDTRMRLLSVNPLATAVHSVSLELFQEILNKNSWLVCLAVLLGFSLLCCLLSLWKTSRLFAPE